MDEYRVDSEFLDDVRYKAVNKWKWRNPYFVGFLAFLHPLFLLLTSVTATIVALGVWLFLWKYTTSLLLRLFLSLGCGFYGYLNTRWKNAAIEKYRFGRLGTGTDDPRKYGGPQNHE